MQCCNIPVTHVLNNNFFRTYLLFFILQLSLSLSLCWFRECVLSNPRYMVTTSDSPSVLHEGSRSNALHMAAKLGRTESASLVLSFVQGNTTTTTMISSDSKHCIAFKLKLFGSEHNVILVSESHLQ